MRNPIAPPTPPIRLIIAFPGLLSGLGVTSGINDTAGVLITVCASIISNNAIRKNAKNPQFTSLFTAALVKSFAASARYFAYGIATFFESALYSSSVIGVSIFSSEE